MPRGVPKNRASGTKHKVEDWVLFYEMYFDTFDLDVEATLRHFGLYDKTKSNGTPRQIWTYNLSHHRDEYEQAKVSYYRSIGCSEESLISRLNDMSRSARSEMVKYQATTYLLEFLTRKYDTQALNTCQKLIIQYEDPVVVNNEENSDL